MRAQMEGGPGGRDEKLRFTVYEVERTVCVHACTYVHIGEGASVATKTITIDMEAYNRLKAVRTLLSGFEISESKAAAACLVGAVAGLLQRACQPAGDMDVLITAMAMAYGHVLTTPNPKHFKPIRHLVAEEY
jgi:predicted nucleic acid-binding protein